MKKFHPALICAAFLSLVCSALAEVGQKVSFPSLADGHIYGEKLSAEDLRGRVVFFEYWGIHCPPCRAAMPHLIELQKKYGSKGFIVIGSHCQGLSPEVAQFLKENKVNFPSYAFKSLPEAPCPGMLPYSVLIGVDGRIVAQGLPGQVYGSVEEAVEKASRGYPILDGVELDKYKSLGKTLFSNASNVESKVEGLRSAAESGDAEAKAVCDAYDAWLTAEKSRIARQCENNPLQAMKSVSALKKAVPSVTEFDEQVKSFRENPVYQKLAAVQKKVDGLQKREAKGKRVTAGAVKGIRKSLDELRDSDAQGVDAVCAEIDSVLDSMEEASAAPRKGRKDKKGKRQESDD